MFSLDSENWNMQTFFMILEMVKQTLKLFESVSV
jgi:hypothetical protein